MFQRLKYPCCRSGKNNASTTRDLAALRRLIGALGGFLRAGLAFALKRLSHLLELLKRFLVGPRKLQIEVFQGADDRRADHHARKPFVIGGYYVPWRCGGNVVHRKFPVFRGLVEPIEKSLTL